MQNKSDKEKPSRRDFVKTGAAAVSAFTIVPSSVLGGRGRVTPNDKINLAAIGTGGQGCVDLRGFMQIPAVQVIAVCDVCKDADYSKFYFGGRAGSQVAKALVEKHYAEQKGVQNYSGCKTYVDFNEMLENETGIDAVVVATTDNVHALASMAAITRGKHVYCEKPLTHDIYEARMLREAARKYKVQTQMGNHGHASEYIRLLVEWIQDGAIGDVTEVHSWTNRPVWPQGIPRPQEAMPVPEGLDWDRWIGPAPFRPYHSIYAPFNWRGWWDFGTGALGDMGCHIMDMPVWALELGHPTSVQASFTPHDRNEAGPAGSIVTYEFPARGSKPPVRYTWYDGGLMPPRPKELDPDKKMPGSGTLVFGSKGVIMADEAGFGRIIPESAMRAYKRPPKRIKRVSGIHSEFIEAIQGGDPPSSNFEVSGPLTEIVLLGNVAIRMGRNVRLEWDGPSMTVTNVPEANQYVRRQYREGWSLNS
ncbi:MAG TPA: Gfo/Idh/MocA family oxidoreductase [Acidobacteriota bacterium]|nr:Gfo/Idh/MocA family oxidoreductase [Acidobacteriota bacterium]